MSEPVFIFLSSWRIYLATFMLCSVFIFDEPCIIIRAAEMDEPRNGSLGNDSACLKGFMDAFYDPQPKTDINDPSTPFTSWTSSALQGNPCVNDAGAQKLFGVTCNNMSRVESIVLHFAGLAGELPSSLSLCYFLTNLDFSFNSITGDMPASLGNLPNLVTLSLASNQISGSIPLELVSCSALNSLDLRNNSLSGPRPVQLGLLPLVEFNVSYNNLSGSIPFTLSNTSSGSPRFGVTSFLRNPGLHGYPLPDEPSESTKASSSQEKMNSALLAITILSTVGVACCLVLICVVYAGYCRICPERGIARKDREQNRLSSSRSSEKPPVDGWKEVLNQLSLSS